MLVIPLFPRLGLIFFALGPFLIYAAWRWGISRLRMTDPAKRCQTLWMLALIPVLNLIVVGIDPKHLTAAPFHWLYFGLGPLQGQKLHQIFMKDIPIPPPDFQHKMPPPQMMPLALLPVFHTAGIFFAPIAGILEYLTAARRVARLPKRREGDVIVVRVPGWSAFTFGLLRPQVFVSEAVWNSPHREAVLAHEQAHRARHDPLIRFLMQGASRLIWYFPFWRRLIGQVGFEAERACDERASEIVGRAAYARALLAFAEQAHTASLPVQPLVSGFADDETGVDGERGLLARARSLAEREPDATPSWFRFLFTLVYVLVAVLA